MQTRIFLLISFFVVLAAIAKAGNEEKIVADFKLKNIDGKEISLTDFPAAKGFIIVFTSNHCPFAKLYPERLNALNSKYALLNVPLIAIRSTDTMLLKEDSFDKMISTAQQYQYTFPYLADDKQTVAKNFGAEKTPHAFVIWKENDQWIIKYSGAIDDNGAEPAKVRHAYVAAAIDELLVGKKVSRPQTKSVGCAIRYKN